MGNDILDEIAIGIPNIDTPDFSHCPGSVYNLGTLQDLQKNVSMER